MLHFNILCRVAVESVDSLMQYEHHLSNQVRNLWKNKGIRGSFWTQVRYSHRKSAIVEEGGSCSPAPVNCIRCNHRASPHGKPSDGFLLLDSDYLYTQSKSVSLKLSKHIVEELWEEKQNNSTSWIYSCISIYWWLIEIWGLLQLLQQKFYLITLCLH